MAELCAHAALLVCLSAVMLFVGELCVFGDVLVLFVRCVVGVWLRCAVWRGGRRTSVLAGLVVFGIVVVRIVVDLGQSVRALRQLPG